MALAAALLLGTGLAGCLSGEAPAATWDSLEGTPDGFADGVDDDTLIALGCLEGESPLQTAEGWACQDAETGETTVRSQTSQPQTGADELGTGLGLTVDGEQLAVDPTEIQVRLARGCPTGQAIRSVAQDGSVTCQAAAVSQDGQGAEAPPAWELGGNTGTVPEADFLGTLDATSLELRVAASPALRLVPGDADGLGTAAVPSLLGGFNGNLLVEGANGAFVGGGGDTDAPNSAGAFAMVGGGVANTAPGDYAVVAGGFENEATEASATVSGGESNLATGPQATVAGGYDNEATASNAYVGGGYDNEANADYATVGGGEFNIADGSEATIGGGTYNRAPGYAATVAGGDSNEATGGSAAIGGGISNTADATHATVGGGLQQPCHRGRRDRLRGRGQHSKRERQHGQRRP